MNSNNEYFTLLPKATEQQINFIKFVREETGMGLKDAKDFVDHLISISNSRAKRLRATSETINNVLNNSDLTPKEIAVVLNNLKNSFGTGNPYDL